ncbi:transposase [Streptomyces klenkii]|uniref:transposase n=1 Tax=Streptomyces klenkii TaxID=1420899 RepID=UPI001F54684F|nr:transposase [Streptomyces klenkii]
MPLVLPRAGLPHVTVVVDHFHVVQLANKMLSLVRRRTTALRGRRGRACDPEWKARRRLLRNREDLTDAQFSTMWNQLIGTGDIGMTLLTAWIAKEKLRDLLALARTTDRHRTSHLRWKFLTWCADCDIPEVRTLARTIDRWWPEIHAFIDTSHNNAKSEGINRMIKLTARAAHGFRNTANQRLRTRCVTTRRARGHLHPAQIRRPGNALRGLAVFGQRYDRLIHAASRTSSNSAWTSRGGRYPIAE